MNQNLVAQVKEASKVYQSGDTSIVALQPCSLQLKRGELVLLLGPSGSGKTTLLSMIGSVIYPTSGTIVIEDQTTSSLNEKELAQLRLKYIGFVFQGYNLLAPLNALENVMLPLQLSYKTSLTEAKKRATEMLAMVQMTDRMYNLPKQLSGGQQQRVAIARALINNPSLILCDEPTAALDPASVTTVMNELKELIKQQKTVVIVTHDTRLIPFADRVYLVNNGTVNSITTEQIKNYELKHEH